MKIDRGFEKEREIDMYLLVHVLSSVAVPKSALLCAMIFRIPERRPKKQRRHKDTRLRTSTHVAKSGQMMMMVNGMRREERGREGKEEGKRTGKRGGEREKGRERETDCRDTN